MSEVLVHTTVLLAEAVEALAIKPDGIYLDCTFGRGGHSALILQQLGANGRLIALDKDMTAVSHGLEWQDARFKMVHSGFTHLAEVLRELGVERVDGILLDLGVSSPQLDEAARGFSFRFDAPLDMRMDNSRGPTAAQWLETADEGLLTEVIRDYGEERFAKQIARAIIVAREIQPIQTTGQLVELVGKTVRTRETGKNPATRTFQAIRIYLNQELEELKQVLPQCVTHLKPGGRLAVISFHSLEDRMVKHFIRDMNDADKLPRNVPIRASEVPKGKLNLIGRAIKAGKDELNSNPRARSAVMRVAERSDVA
ncbi:16S rRNA (cytosine(1402)-N(4))-methyltransferase RsmH [Gallionella capsiferriformans]|uniref:Ribosomal RNA small subunit methyltransferase H n=1 Tax=Gallionella capsiferriformans (strain ES-2) TaxID=395494 RepID=D9SJM2_GALCS|nr:16S rRNA (cytosine(1402)-N(4))-methyltransferase RsmH [Gallionella capsiferriformans]ADL54370.1 S-adenosyl-methyltransferase MraW [Gallionella capsiferriformans ES-2]